MEKFNKFIIHFWLAVTLASLIYALVMINNQGWDVAKQNLVIPAIAFMWYMFRRSMHKRMERNAQQRNEN